MSGDAVRRPADASSGQGAVAGHHVDGIRPPDRETHYVMPATSTTLCAEPIETTWQHVEDPV